MILVPILLDVHGLGRKILPLGSIVITNDGTGTLKRRNYNVKQLAKNTNHVVREAQLRDWPANDRSPVQLLAAALRALGH